MTFPGPGSGQIQLKIKRRGEKAQCFAHLLLFRNPAVSVGAFAYTAASQRLAGPPYMWSYPEDEGAGGVTGAELTGFSAVFGPSFFDRIMPW